LIEAEELFRINVCKFLKTSSNKLLSSERNIFKVKSKVFNRQRNNCKMRFLIALCLLLIAVYVAADPIQAKPTMTLVSKDDQADSLGLTTTDIEGNSKAGCTDNWCFNVCWNLGFRPTFSFGCISASTCRCVQY